MKDNMNGKVSWNVFAYRFEDREQITFEELCYQLFCRKFDLKEGLHRFYNQHYIETDPARISETRVVGFQAKYFESKVINDNQKRLLKETIEKAAVKYPEMTELFFYITSEFSESSKPDQTKTEGQIAIEECAREHGIKLEWVMRSNLEVILQGEEYRSIWNYYFNPDPAKAGRSALSAEVESIVRYAHFITEKYTELNSNIVNGNEPLKDAYIPLYLKTSPRISMKEFLEKFVQGDERVAVIYGEPGHGKTSLCVKAAYDFYNEKWLKDAVNNVFLFSLNPTGTMAINHSYKTFSFEKLMAWGDDRLNDDNLIDGKSCKNSLVFLDGFDELIENIRSSTNGYFDNLEGFISDFVTDFASKYNCHVVITSRKMCIQQELEEESPVNNIAGAQCWELDLISFEEQDEWLDKYAERVRNRDGSSDGSLPEETEQFIENFKRQRLGKSFTKLTGVPILFRMIVYNKLDQKYSCTAELYDELFKVMLVKRNLKSKSTTFRSRLEDLALAIYKGNDDSIQRGILYGQDDEEQYMNEWTYSFFVENKTKQQICFFHRSFYQYFLADYMFKQVRGCRSKEKIDDFLTLLSRRKIDYTTFQFMNDRKQISRKNLDSVIQAIVDYYEENGGVILAAYEADWSHEVGRTWLTKNILWNLVGLVSALCNEFTYSEKFGYLITNYSSSGLMISSRNVSKTRVNLSNGKMNNAMLYLGYLDNIIAQSSEWIGSSLARVRMRNADFSNSLLTFSDFTHANMIGIHMQNADLRSALLIGARLRDADLYQAKIEDANLSKATLKNANLRMADLTNADLSKANLDNVTLEGTILNCANMEGARLAGAAICNTEENDAAIQNVNLSGAYLRKIRIENAVFVSTNFAKADMMDCVIKNCRFENVTFDEADLGGAVLENVIFKNVSFKSANLNRTRQINVTVNIGDYSDATFRTAHIEDSSFTLSDHTDVRYRKAELVNVEFHNSKLHKALFAKCKADGLTFDGCDLSYARFDRNIGDNYSISRCDTEETVFIDREESAEEAGT